MSYVFFGPKMVIIFFLLLIIFLYFAFGGISYRETITYRKTVLVKKPDNIMRNFETSIFREWKSILEYVEDMNDEPFLNGTFGEWVLKQKTNYEHNEQRTANRISYIYNVVSKHEKVIVQASDFDYIKDILGAPKVIFKSFGKKNTSILGVSKYAKYKNAIIMFEEEYIRYTDRPPIIIYLIELNKKLVKENKTLIIHTYKRDRNFWQSWMNENYPKYDVDKDYDNIKKFAETQMGVDDTVFGEEEREDDIASNLCLSYSDIFDARKFILTIIETFIEKMKICSNIRVQHDTIDYYTVAQLIIDGIIKDSSFYGIDLDEFTTDEKMLKSIIKPKLKNADYHLFIMHENRFTRDKLLVDNLFFD